MENPHTRMITKLTGQIVRSYRKTTIKLKKERTEILVEPSAKMSFYIFSHPRKSAVVILFQVKCELSDCCAIILK